MFAIDQKILEAMTEQLKEHSSFFAFVQARVSAESLVRDTCALALHTIIGKDAYHVHMEKKVQGKKVDVIICPIKEKTECFEKACLLEFKMAWPGGLGECSHKVCGDLEALRGKHNAWSIVLFFAFSSANRWMPFGQRKFEFPEGLDEFIRRVDSGIPIMGPIFQFEHEDVSGDAQLLAWRATPDAV